MQWELSCFSSPFCLPGSRKCSGGACFTAVEAGQEVRHPLFCCFFGRKPPLITCVLQNLLPPFLQCAFSSSSFSSFPLSDPKTCLQSHPSFPFLKSLHLLLPVLSLPFTLFPSLFSYFPSLLPVFLSPSSYLTPLLFIHHVLPTKEDKHASGNPLCYSLL